MPVAKGETIDLERTRRKVLSAATEVFYREGTAVGVNEIAERAGVSKLTLYRHFGSKDGLLDEVLHARSDAVFAWLTSGLDNAADPVERVLAVFDALHRWHREAAFRGCAIVNAATQSPDGPAGRRAEVHLARYRALLTELADDAGAVDAERVARQLLILVEGATTVAAVGEDRYAGADARDAARTLLLAAGASRRSERRAAS